MNKRVCLDINKLFLSAKVHWEIETSKLMSERNGFKLMEYTYFCVENGYEILNGNDKFNWKFYRFLYVQNINQL